MANHGSLQLRSAVHHAYSAAAERPTQKHAFPVGRLLVERLGYPADVLDILPPVSVEAFAGVSNLAVSVAIAADTHVLDLGCGAGLDSLILARRLGGTGRVVGIDFSEAMLMRARTAAAAYGVNGTFCLGDAERLPFDEASIDVAFVNGIFNLNPARAEIFRELARVVRANGHVYVAELVLQEAVSKPDHFGGRLGGSRPLSIRAVSTDDVPVGFLEIDRTVAGRCYGGIRQARQSRPLSFAAWPGS